MREKFKIITIGIAMALLALAIFHEPVKAAGFSDSNPVPDKFNTGAATPEEGFSQVELGGSFDCLCNGTSSSLTFLVSGGSKNVFNLAYANRDMSGTYVIEDADFTIAPIAIYGEGDWDKKADGTGEKLKFIFKNCKFSSFGTGRYELNNISYEFYNCSFQNIYGSNTILDRCYFGGGYGDRINPFTNFYVNYCYIANPTYEKATDALVHVDGVQIYGDYKDHVDIHDIYFNGCRFEMPTCRYPNAPNIYVNACIMLQLEFSSGYNMGFTNCILNGGGYSVYAHTKYDSLTLKNITFKNLMVGGGRNWGMLYPHKSETIDFNMDTWTETSGIYVGSVWSDSKSTSLSVTNDTTQERQFKVVSASGKTYKFKIPACPTGLEMKNHCFEDLPFDVVYTIPEKTDQLTIYEKQTNAATGKAKYVKVSKRTIGINSTKAPKSTKIVKVSRSKRYFRVKWKKIKKNASGYQLQISTSKKFTKKTTRNVYIKSKNKTTYTRKAFKSKKRLYIRVRGYKIIRINGKQRRIYSKWSKTFKTP